MTTTSTTGSAGAREFLPAPAGPPSARRRSPRLSLGRRRTIFGYALLTPAILFVGVLIAYPLILSVQLSITPGRFASLNSAGEGITFDHYLTVLTSPETWASLLRTGVYVVGTVVPAFAVGLAIALLLREAFPGRRWLRTMILLPWAVPGVAASAVFLWMFDASFGVVNKLLMHLGLISQPIAWYADPHTAMFAVIVPTAWKLFPFFAMILLAALQTIPGDLYEAARVDGAGRFQQFVHVTWPGVRGAAYIALVIASLGVYREFDFIFPLTRGGPNDSTTTLAIGIYQESFQYSNMGFAAALGIVSIVIAAVFVLLVGRERRKG